eukprot:TRINITY_DN4367_c0_g1_i1.p1 TRINITY_DN4367_c0_g1~~TRINITY_DN4367_c0_g1_i1.p1  ORF type:complete len:401 (-),score=36.08 TRINITY_DN4367_c0_g1_i1:96-1298(-)
MVRALVLLVLAFLLAVISATALLHKSEAFYQEFSDDFALNRPKIAPQFSAELEISYINITFPASYGVIKYDSEVKAMIIGNFEPVFYTQAFVQQIAVDGYIWDAVNNQCRPAGSGFPNLFGWLVLAQSAGVDVIHNIPCNVWYLELPTGNISTCLAGNLPLRLTISLGTSNPPTAQVLDFYNVNPNLKEPILLPQECINPLICPIGEVVDMEVFRFHTEDYTLDNEDVADALGDASYICLTGSTGDTLVSLYSIQVNTTWGQYALCNNKDCVSLQYTLVGHEAPYGVGKHGGQCNEATGLGNWYSLDASAKCPNGVGVAGNWCTWKPLSLIKTVSLDCLVNKVGFYNACRQDGRSPFTKAASVLTAAFSSDNPSHGGCPDVNADDTKRVLFHEISKLAGH